MKLKKHLYCSLISSILFFIIFSLSSLTKEAHATLLVEPHLSYNFIGGGTNNGTEFSYNGPQYGLRLGGNYLGAFGGLDFNFSSYTWTKKSNSAYTADDFHRTEIGLFAGYNFPLLIRAWLGYYFLQTAKDQEAGGSSSTGDKYQGHSIELAVGYTIIPNVSANFIYRRIIINEQHLSSTPQTSITGGDISNHEILLGVSAPFTFL